ncbi:hypothetical protein HZH66_009712 [Vespula vulgaris]|uniref:Uncharacterized protein n=1 Tax=Vespula vulgaris TaxID=7454 RepID=A0A834MZU4_VESVU|nr:hypothetical protein HZH66_009712 [Vespula vulgaris]
MEVVMEELEKIELVWVMEKEEKDKGIEKTEHSPSTYSKRKIRNVQGENINDESATLQKKKNSREKK